MRRWRSTVRRGSQRWPSHSRGYELRAMEFKPGEIYKDAKVRVQAFRLEHAGWPHAYGFRFTTPGGVIVVSGDCIPAQAVIDACQGCDGLVHEVYSMAGIARRPPEWQLKRLVLTHQLRWPAGVCRRGPLR